MTRTILKQLSGTTISVDDQGRFHAEIGGRTVTRAKLADLERQIRGSGEAAVVFTSNYTLGQGTFISQGTITDLEDTPPHRFRKIGDRGYMHFHTDGPFLPDPDTEAEWNRFAQHRIATIRALDEEARAIRAKFKRPTTADLTAPNRGTDD